MLFRELGMSFQACRPEVLAIVRIFVERWLRNVLQNDADNAEKCAFRISEGCRLRQFTQFGSVCRQNPKLSPQSRVAPTIPKYCPTLSVVLPSDPQRSWKRPCKRQGTHLKKQGARRATSAERATDEYVK